VVAEHNYACHVSARFVCLYASALWGVSWLNVCVRIYPQPQICLMGVSPMAYVWSLTMPLIFFVARLIRFTLLGIFIFARF